LPLSNVSMTSSGQIGARMKKKPRRDPNVKTEIRDG
jgi:hypothetical protein